VPFQTARLTSNAVTSFCGRELSERWTISGIGGIGGAIGGFLSGLGSHCSPWKSAGCGALGGAINGCVSGAVCTTQPTWCVAASCLGGAAGNLAQQLCMGGGPSGTCGAISAAIDTAVGCLGGVAALSDSEKIALEQFLAWSAESMGRFRFGEFS